MQNFVEYATSSLNSEQKLQYVQGLAVVTSQCEAGVIPAMVTYQDITGKGMLNYTGGMKIPKTVAHFGQRKLFLSELHFLTSYLKQRSNNDQLPILVIYPGAAPSKHTGYLASLFPEVTFLLVDPSEFRIKRHFSNEPTINLTPLAPDSTTGDWSTLISEISLDSRTYIFNGLFTDALAHGLAEKFSGIAELLLISDIRTNTAAYIPDDLDTCWNLAQQFLWVKIINPHAYLLKFRYPYFVDTSRGEHASVTSFVDRFNKCAGEQMFVDTFSEAHKYGLDMAADYTAQRIRYLPGNLDLQAFPGQNSTELRLSNLDYHNCNTLVNYPDWKTYESEMCMYNKVWRPLMYHHNPYASYKLGFDHCNDCALEALFWEEYLRYRKQPINTKIIHQHLLNLNRFSCGPLKVHNHGFWYGDYQELLDQLHSENNSENSGIVPSSSTVSADS